jgi:hypothetical protein
MKVKIQHTKTGQLINALIKDGSLYSLPKPEYGWKFDFEKFSVGANNFVYVLCREDEVSTIEGCLIFKLLNNNEPILAYIEAAPHNKGKDKTYENVGACLIAYACKLSFQYGHLQFKGWLAFTVQEKDTELQTKLMKLYKEKYFAKKLTKTAMIIQPIDAEKLIERHLNI